MTADRDRERRFIEEVEAFDLSTRESGQALRTLDDWYARFLVDLEGEADSRGDDRTRGALGRQLAEAHAAVRRHMQAWPGLRATLQDADALADVFGGRVLVLVFGKFNAGKSSFCNFIAERYLAHGKTVAYFRLDAGQIVESTERFREGETETTTEVQGVRLGDKLLLLDTPGLHSVTRDNATLTRRFTESADLMLWLTSSTSPGQVQELEELGRELQRHKVLLPVLTRSDVYDEDEVNGELIRLLRNKPTRNRALQEADVLARSRDKLVAMAVDPALVKPPVSVSVLAAREQGLTSAARAEAGFERLYDALLATAAPALAYKRRKRAEVFLHYLEEVVLGAMQGDVRALLTALDESSRNAIEQLQTRLEQVEGAVWRHVMPTLPDALERHAATMDTVGLTASVSRSIHTAFVAALKEHLGDYDLTVAAVETQVALDEGARYEAIAVDGDALEDRPRGSSDIDVPMLGVSYERLYVALEKAMRATLQRSCAVTSEQCRAAVLTSAQASADLQALVERYAEELSVLKRTLRSSMPATV